MLHKVTTKQRTCFSSTFYFKQHQFPKIYLTAKKHTILEKRNEKMLMHKATQCIKTWVCTIFLNWRLNSTYFIYMWFYI